MTPVTVHDNDFDMLERQAHDDRIPELAAGSPVVLDAVPFLDEAALAVQGDRGRVVREYLERELVQPVAARPVDGRLEQGRANSAAAPVAVDQHPELTEPVPADLGMDHPDDLIAGRRDDRGGAAGGEPRGPFGHIDRWFAGDPVTFLRDGREELSHRRRVGRRGRSHDELWHGYTSRMNRAAGLRAAMVCGRMYFFWSSCWPCSRRVK